MQRNSNALRPLVILAAVALLVTVPILLSGLVEVRRGYADREIGQHASAAEHLRHGAQRLPWRTDLWELAGIEALAAGRPEEAIPMLERAPVRGAEGQVALALAYMQTGNLDAARDAYEDALLKGATVEVYSGLATIYRMQADRLSERAALQNLLLFQPENAAAQYRLGLLLSGTDMDLALIHLQLAAQLDAEYRPVFETLRSALVLAGRESDPGRRYVTVGRALGLVEEWGLAATIFQQAVEADPSNGEAWAWLGEALWHRKDLGDPSEAMERALELAPGSVVVRGLRGLYWKRMNDEPKAIAEFEAAAALDPENPAWMISLGESRARLGDLVTALADYERAAQADPQNPVYWRMLAQFCGDYNINIADVGLPAAQKVVELVPGDTQGRDLLGWLQLLSGDVQAAKQTLLAVLEVEPNMALAHYHLALVYMQEGDNSAAARHLDLAIQFDPEGSAGTKAAQLKEQFFP